MYARAAAEGLHAGVIMSWERGAGCGMRGTGVSNCGRQDVKRAAGFGSHGVALAKPESPRIAWTQRVYVLAAGLVQVRSARTLGPIITVWHAVP